MKAATASEPPPLRWFDLDEVMLECNNELEALEVTMKQSSEVKRDGGVLNSSSEVVTKGALHNLDRSTRELKDILDVAPLSQIENVEASLTHTSKYHDHISCVHSLTSNGKLRPFRLSKQ